MTPRAIIAADRDAPWAKRIAEETGVLFAEASARGVMRAIGEARAELHRASNGDSAPLSAILPASHPELAVLAAAERADRIGVHFDGRALDPRLVGRALRAAFALVDLTIVPDAAAERCAIRAGADPSRIVREGVAGIATRLAREPQRMQRSRAAREVALSLALDALELSGFVRLAELAAPDRGVNVVNYHRILPVGEIVSYWRPQMVLAEPLFEAQLDEMARHHGFTAIEAVREETSAGRVAITFDDGYEDNFRVALPVLQRFSTPACIFVVTNLIGRKDALWWDRLGLALFAYWRDGAEKSIPDALPERAQSIRAARSIEEVRAIVSGLITELNLANTEAREAAVSAAESLVPKLKAGRTMLTWEEVQAMAKLGISFGAHTKNHVPLDEVPREVAHAELFDSQEDLDLRLRSSQPKVVALPRGRLGELTEEEIRLGGVRAVMTSEPGVNRPGERSLFVRRRDGRMLTLGGRHHPAKLRLELTGLMDRLRRFLKRGETQLPDHHGGRA